MYQCINPKVSTLIKFDLSKSLPIRERSRKDRTVLLPIFPDQFQPVKNKSIKFI